MVRPGPWSAIATRKVSLLVVYDDWAFALVASLKRLYTTSAERSEMSV
jgi:hypothetical protein